MTTIQEAQATVGIYGMAIKRDPDTDDFMVYPIGTKAPKEAAATYFTDDLQDAVDTARFIQTGSSLTLAEKAKALAQAGRNDRHKSLLVQLPFCTDEETNAVAVVLLSHLGKHSREPVLQWAARHLLRTQAVEAAGIVEEFHDRVFGDRPLDLNPPV